MNSFIANIINQEAVLGPEESLHCCRVLRKKPGDRILVIDGLGTSYEASLELVSDKLCKAKLIGEGKQQVKRDYALHLAIAPTKQIDRMEWLLEKAVEIGIDEITLFRSQHSERVQVNMARLKKIIESAVKQSLQARIPALHGTLDFVNILTQPAADQKWIAHCQPAAKTNIRQVHFKNRKNLVLIGPEGDFSPAEIELANSKGFRNLSLGTNRLRTETAGLTVVQAAYLLA